jgi:hypothetical protein
LALSLGACASGALKTAETSASGPPSAWIFERDDDRIAGRPTVTAVTVARSRNALLSRDKPFMTQKAGLQLECFKRDPMVRLVFNYRVGANRSASVAYRFDDKPGREANARFLANFRTIVIEDKADVARFAEELRTSSVLYVRVNSLIVGESTAEFRVHGAPQAIEAAFADCPLPAPKPTRRASA